MPIFGWLLLAGKCRDCGSTISARYPLVEVLFGCLLAGLGWLEIIGGVRKPARVAGECGRLAAAKRLDPGRLSHAPAEHAAGCRNDRMGSTAGAAAAVDFCASRGIVAAARLECAKTRAADRKAARVLIGAAGPAAPQEGLAGVAAGLFMGLLAWPSIALGQMRRTDGKPAAGNDGPAIVSSPGIRPTSSLLAGAAVGAFLGWQAAVGVVAHAVLLDLLAAVCLLVVPGVRRVGWCLCLTIAALAWLAYWATIERDIEQHWQQLDWLLVAGEPRRPPRRSSLGGCGKRRSANRQRQAGPRACLLHAFVGWHAGQHRPVWVASAGRCFGRGQPQLLAARFRSVRANGSLGSS